MIRDFVMAFRRYFCVAEVADYVHLLAHVPILTTMFGNLFSFMQQSGEQANFVVNNTILKICSPFNAHEQARKACARKLFY